LQTGILGLQAGKFRLQTGILGLQAGKFRLQTGILGLQAGKFRLQTGILGLQPFYFCFQILKPSEQRGCRQCLFRHGYSLTPFRVKWVGSYPAFEKTGILTLTYLDENGAPQTIFYNPELGFLPKTEISTDIDHPTFLPWEAIHSRFPPHVQLLILDGYDQPFVYPEGEKFEGWRIQFIYDQKTQSKMAFLRPTNSHSQQWVLNEQQQPVWFVTYAPDGSRHQMSVVRIHNPKDPGQPAADETMFLLVSWGEWMNKRPLNYRNGFKHTYLNMQERPQDYYFTHFVPYVVIATENGYLEKSPWGNFPGRPSLDSLLGMEGNDVSKLPYWSHDIEVRLGEVGTNSNIIEVILFSPEYPGDPLPPNVEQFVLPLSP
jgi:hypothetical protein